MSSQTGSSTKIRSRQAFIRMAQKCRASGKRVVFTNGCFDLLHAGHVTYLEKAKRMGDVLVVGVNSDASIRRIKGPDRPVHSEKDRLRVLAALEAVDSVALFSEDTPLELIRQVRPDILVKGADWKENQIVGATEVRSWGGVVRRIPLVRGRSTTAALVKLRSNHPQ